MFTNEERKGFPILKLDSQLSKINLLQFHKSFTSSVSWYTDELLKTYWNILELGSFCNILKCSYLLDMQHSLFPYCLYSILFCRFIMSCKDETHGYCTPDWLCVQFKGYGHEFRPVTPVIRDMQGRGKAFELTLDPTASWVFALFVFREQPFNKNEPAIMFLVQL